MNILHCVLNGGKSRVNVSSRYPNGHIIGKNRMLKATRWVLKKVVNHNKEEGWGEDTALREAVILIKIGRKCVTASYVKCSIFEEIRDIMGHVAANTCLMKFDQKGLFIYFIKGVLKINENCKCIHVILEALLDVINEVDYIVCGGAAGPKSCLMWREEVVTF